jgi:hypothetical protein
MLIFTNLQSKKEKSGQQDGHGQVKGVCGLPVRESFGKIPVDNIQVTCHPTEWYYSAQVR